MLACGQFRYGFRPKSGTQRTMRGRTLSRRRQSITLTILDKQCEHLACRSSVDERYRDGLPGCWSERRLVSISASLCAPEPQAWRCANELRPFNRCRTAATFGTESRLSVLVAERRRGQVLPQEPTTASQLWPPEWSGPYHSCSWVDTGCCWLLHKISDPATLYQHKVAPFAYAQALGG